MDKDSNSTLRAYLGGCTKSIKMRKSKTLQEKTRLTYRKLGN
ncbi:MAG TPA: hypothetical protein VHJ38_11095 [Nitrososphaeraceae archaeon]|nr:hypothetical protein [Nitrososphaeraceae archaeon]